MDNPIEEPIDLVIEQAIRGAEELARTSLPEGRELPEGYIDDAVFGPAYLSSQMGQGGTRIKKRRILGLWSMD